MNYPIFKTNQQVKNHLESILDNLIEDGREVSTHSFSSAINYSCKCGYTNGMSLTVFFGKNERPEIFSACDCEMCGE